MRAQPSTLDNKQALPRQRQHVSQATDTYIRRRKIPSSTGGSGRIRKGYKLGEAIPIKVIGANKNSDGHVEYAVECRRENGIPVVCFINKESVKNDIAEVIIKFYEENAKIESFAQSESKKKYVKAELPVIVANPMIIKQEFYDPNK